MNIQEKINEIYLTSPAVEQVTAGYISANRWRDLKIGRGSKIKVFEELCIDVILKNQNKAKKQIAKIYEGRNENRFRNNN